MITAQTAPDLLALQVAHKCGNCHFWFRAYHHSTQGKSLICALLCGILGSPLMLRCQQNNRTSVNVNNHKIVFDDDDNADDDDELSTTNGETHQDLANSKIEV